MFLLRIFKNSRSGGLAGLFLLALAIFMKTFIFAVQNGGSDVATDHAAMPFYNLLFGAIPTKPILDHIAALALSLFITYMLIRIGGRYVLFEFRTFMPGLFFMLFSFALPETQQVSPSLVGAIFYLFCFAILFDFNDKRPDTLSVFLASLILVLGSMFYLKLIWFIPLIWISLLTMRQPTWRELLFPVVAYLLLGLLLIAWYWGVLNDSATLWKLISNNLAFTRSEYSYHLSTYLYFGYFFLLILVASIYMINRFQSRKTVIQNIYQVLFYMFLAGILFFIVINRYNPANLIFIAIPVAYILSNYFHRKRSYLLHELALWILVGLLVYVQIMA